MEGNFAGMLYRGGDDVSLLWFVLDGRFGGTCPGGGVVFTYRLAYAAGYGLRSYVCYTAVDRDEECMVLLSGIGCKG